MKFKSFLMVMLLSVASAFSATVPKDFTVYSSQISGDRNVACRMLFKLYAEKYDANPVFNIKQGAGGMLAYDEMVKDKKFSVYCSGFSEVVLNDFLYPGNEVLHSKLKVVTPIIVSGIVFYAPPNSPYNSIQELLKAKKSINVATYGEGQKLVGHLALSGDVNWIMFKNINDIVPSLLDGSLDLMVGGGSLDHMVKSGKLKSFGHVNGTGALTAKDLSKDFPKSAAVKIFTSVVVSSDEDSALVEELNVRFKTLIADPQFVEACNTMGAQPIWMSVKEANQSVNTAKEEYKKLKASSK